MDVVDNHRGHQERRQFDSALPTGHFDRRHIVDRRSAEMEVLRLSDLDWQSFFGDSPKLSEKSLHKTAQETDVLNKTHTGER